MWMNFVIGLVGCTLGISSLCDCDDHRSDNQKQTQSNEIAESYQDPVSVQIHTETGHIVMPVWIEENGPHWFVLDTGNQNTTFFARIAKEVGVETRPLGEMGGAGSGSIKVSQASDVRVGIGVDGSEIEFVDPVVTVLPDAAGLPDFNGKTVAGFLGATFIERYITSIDYTKDELSLMSHDEFVVSDDAQVMDMKLAFGFPYFEGTVIPTIHGENTEAIEGNYLLDLGDSNGIGIEYDRAQICGLIDSDDPAQKIIGMGQGIDGVPFKMKSAPVDSITMGGMSIEDSVVVFSTSPGGGPPIPDLVGTVGSGVFTGSVVTLDYKGGRLILTN